MGSQQPAAIAYLSADVIGLTGITDSYLAFLVRKGLVTPTKHWSNSRTNLFSEEDIARIHWVVEHRGQMSVREMQEQLGVRRTYTPAAEAAV